MAVVGLQKHQPPRGESVGPADIVRVQDGVGQWIDRLYKAVPFLDGHQLDPIVWTGPGHKDVAHKLGRKIRGWFVVRDDARPVFVEAYRDLPALSLTAGTLTQMVWTSEREDFGGDYDTTTGVFVAPHAGIYTYAPVIFIANATDGSRFYADLYVNGVKGRSNDLVIEYGATTTNLSLGRRQTLTLASGDSVTLQMGNQDATNRNTPTGDGQDWLSIRSDESLEESQPADLDATKYLRLWSARERTTSIWVF